jgi:hypothetical protein
MRRRACAAVIRPGDAEPRGRGTGEAGVVSERHGAISLHNPRQQRYWRYGNPAARSGRPRPSPCYAGRPCSTDRSLDAAAVRTWEFWAKDSQPGLGVR